MSQPSRFAEVPVQARTAKKQNTGKKTFVVNGVVYTYQKGDLKGQPSGNAGVTLEFDKTHNDLVKTAIAKVDPSHEFKWNGKDAHKMKIHNVRQLDKVLGVVDDYTKVSTRTAAHSQRAKCGTSPTQTACRRPKASPR